MWARLWVFHKHFQPFPSNPPQHLIKPLHFNCLSNYVRQCNEKPRYFASSFILFNIIFHQKDFLLQQFCSTYCLQISSWDFFIKSHHKLMLYIYFFSPIPTSITNHKIKNTHDIYLQKNTKKIIKKHEINRERVPVLANWRFRHHRLINHCKFFCWYWLLAKFLAKKKHFRIEVSRETFLD